MMGRGSNGPDCPLSSDARDPARPDGMAEEVWRNETPEGHMVGLAELLGA
jgi:hypothetical protein